MQFEHHGHTVTVITDTFMFCVTGPQFGDDKGYTSTFASAAEAMREIEKRIDAAQKQAVASARVSLPAIDASTGDHITIRGINRTDSRVLGATVAKGGLPFDFFPAVPWIENLLVVRRDLRASIAKIDRRLLPLGMSASVGYGRISPEKYDAALATLEAEYSLKAQAALASEPKDGEA